MYFFTSSKSRAASSLEEAMRSLTSFSSSHGARKESSSGIIDVSIDGGSVRSPCRARDRRAPRPGAALGKVDSRGASPIGKGIAQAAREGPFHRENRGGTAAALA